GGEDGAVDVGLGGEVDHVVGLGGQLAHQFGVPDVALHELQARVVEFEVVEGAGVGEGVQHGDPRRVGRVGREEGADVAGADEAGGAGDEGVHVWICTLLWSPRTSRWALGTLGAGVTSTCRPISEASIRLTPSMEESRSTMENSTSLSVIRQFSATEVKGPM